MYVYGGWFKACDFVHGRRLAWQGRVGNLHGEVMGIEAHGGGAGRLHGKGAWGRMAGTCMVIAHGQHECLVYMGTLHGWCTWAPYMAGVHGHLAWGF